MPFGNYKTLGEALGALQIRETTEAFVEPTPVALSDYFRSELEITLRDFDVSCSEFAVCENLLFPVLREAIKAHTSVLGVWSHVSLSHGDKLLGSPDYTIARRSPLSARVMGTPLAMIMEAKKNDFDAGWGQCLAAMRAVQDVNGEPGRVVYGCATDGFTWRFGKLVGQTFAHHPQDYSLTRLDELFGALHHVLELCKRQVLTPAAAA